MAFADDRRRHGFWPAVRASIFRRLERKLGLHVWEVCTRPVAGDAVSAAIDTGDFSVRRLSQTELEALTQRAEMKLSADFVAAELARGSLCMAVFSGDEVAGYVWRSPFGDFVRPDLALRMNSPRFWYGFKSFVHPRHRGRGVYGLLDHPADGELRAQGADELVGYVALHNLASLRTVYRDGLRKPVGHAGFIAIAGRVFTFRSPGASKYIRFAHHSSG